MLFFVKVYTSKLLSTEGELTDIIFPNYQIRRITDPFSSPAGLMDMESITLSTGMYLSELTLNLQARLGRTRTLESEKWQLSAKLSISLTSSCESLSLTNSHARTVRSLS